METGHAEQVEILMVMAKKKTTTRQPRGLGFFFAIVKYEVWMRPGQAMVPLQGRAGASSTGAKREGHW